LRKQKEREEEEARISRQRLDAEIRAAVLEKNLKLARESVAKKQRDMEAEQKWIEQQEAQAKKDAEELERLKALEEEKGRGPRSREDHDNRKGGGPKYPPDQPDAPSQ
jgi:multidrug resistance efflux pump